MPQEAPLLDAGEHISG